MSAEQIVNGCPFCKSAIEQEAVPEDRMFCEDCGSRLRGPCPECEDRLSSPFASFCRQCGKHFNRTQDEV